MKQKTLKTLMFAITTICVGSLYGQTTKTFQRITSMEELTDGNYLIVGYASVNNNDFYYTMGNMYQYSSYIARKAINLEGKLTNNIITTPIASSTTNEELPISIKIAKTDEDKNIYTLFDNVSQQYIANSKDDFVTYTPEQLNDNCYVDINWGTTGFIIICSPNRYLSFSYSTGTNATKPSFPRFNIGYIKNLYLFKEVPYAYTREITSSNIGTICLPYTFDVSDNTDAKFYEIEGKTTEGGETVLVFSQVTTLEAGYPYIFKPEDGITSLSFTYTGTDNPVTTALNKNGLYGTFEEISDIKTTIGANVYLLSSNEIRPCGSNNGLKANRAYIIMNEVPEYHSNTSQAKAILRVSINDSSTSIEALDSSESQPTEYRSIDGTKLSAPQKGLNIVKMSDGSTQKVFVP